MASLEPDSQQVASMSRKVCVKCDFCLQIYAMKTCGAYRASFVNCYINILATVWSTNVDCKQRRQSVLGSNVPCKV
jgi:hypothetical protein